MTLDKKFEIRNSDIQETTQLLEFLISIETHKNSPLIDNTTGNTLIVSQEMQCAFKAEFLILLYNIVESTVCDCLNSIYDAIIDEDLEYKDVTAEMQHLWRSHLKKANHPDAEKDDAILANMKIRFEELAISISGSLDFRKIVDVFKKHGCQLDVSKRDKLGGSFLVVKTKRNHLAHGNVSFSECGSGYILSDLLKYKDDILEYLEVVVSSSKDFVTNRNYAR